MHAGEHAVTAARARALIAAQMPDLADLPLRRVGQTGTDNVLDRLGPALVARFPRLPWGAAEVLHLARWLPTLTPLPLSIPLATRLGQPDAAYPHPWSIGPWLPGRDAFTAPPDQRTAVPILAQFLKTLHNHPRRPDAPLRGQADRFDLRLTAARPLIAQLTPAEGDADLLLHLLTRAQATPPFAGTPVWIHGDLHPANLLTRRGRLTSVIDWGGMGLGDPGMDLMVAWTLLDAQARAAFKAAMEPDPAAWARGRAQALGKALQAIPYYRHTNPEFHRQMCQTLARVAADPDAA